MDRTLLPFVGKGGVTPFNGIRPNHRERWSAVRDALQGRAAVHFIQTKGAAIHVCLVVIVRVRNPSSVTGAGVNFNAAHVRVHDDVCFDRRHGAVGGAFLDHIVCASAARENFRDDAGSVDDRRVAGGGLADHPDVGIVEARFIHAHLDVGTKGPARRWEESRKDLAQIEADAIVVERTAGKRDREAVVQFESRFLRFFPEHELGGFELRNDRLSHGIDASFADASRLTRPSKGEIVRAREPNIDFPSAESQSRARFTCPLRHTSGIPHSGRDTGRYGVPFAVNSVLHQDAQRRLSRGCVNIVERERPRASR